MSELVLKTRAGAEFWTDTDDCTAEGNFNVFYFASHNDEQPQAVASDCDSWAAAADQLAGYVKPADWEAFKYEFLSAQVPIVESVDIDLSSRDTFDAGTDTEYSAVTGTAWLSNHFADENESAIVFNLYVPAYGAAYVSFCSPLPTSVSLAEETLEAAVLAAAGREIDAIRGAIAAEHIGECVNEAREGLRKVAFSLNAAIDDATALDSPEVAGLNRLAEKVYRLERELVRYRDSL